MPDAERCATCRFWDSSLEMDEMNRVSGECRRYAPRSIFIMELPEGENTDNTLAIWPETQSDDWCGEWQSQPLVPQPLAIVDDDKRYSLLELVAEMRRKMAIEENRASLCLQRIEEGCARQPQIHRRKEALREAERLRKLIEAIESVIPPAVSVPCQIADKWASVKLTQIDPYLGVRAINALHASGVFNVGALLRLSADDLSNCPGMGEITIDGIRHTLTANGLKLGGDP